MSLAGSRASLCILCSRQTPTMDHPAAAVEQLLSQPQWMGEIHARACAMLGDAMCERAEWMQHHAAAAAASSPIAPTHASSAAAASPSPALASTSHPALSALTSSPLSLPSALSLGAGMLATTSSAGLQPVSTEASARAARSSKAWWERRRARVCGGSAAAAAAAAMEESLPAAAVPASCRALDRSVGLGFPLSGPAFLHRLSSLLSGGHSSMTDSIEVLVRLMEEEAAHAQIQIQADAAQTMLLPPSSLSDPALASTAPLPVLSFQTAYVDFLIYLSSRLASTTGEGRALVQFVDELECVEKQRAAVWNQNHGADAAGAGLIGAYSSPVYGCLSYLQRCVSLHLSREWPLDLNTSRGAFVMLLLEHEVMSAMLSQWLCNRNRAGEAGQQHHGSGGSEDVQVFARLLPQTATLEGQLAQHAKDAANPFYKAPLHANFRLHYSAAVPAPPRAPPHALNVRNAGAPVPIPTGGSMQRAALYPRDLFLTAHDVHMLIAESFAQSIHDHLCPRAATAAGAAVAQSGAQLGSIRIQHRASSGPSAATAASASALPPFSAQLDLLHQRLVHPPAIPSTPHARILVPASAPAPAPPGSPAAASAGAGWASPLSRARSRELAGTASVGVQDPYAATPHTALSAQAMERPSSRHEAFSFRRGGADSNIGEGAAVLAAAVMQHRIDRERAEATAASTAAATAASALASQPASASASCPASSPSVPASTMFGESPFARTGNFMPRAALSSRAAVGDRPESPTRAAQVALRQQQLQAEESKEQAASTSDPAALLAARRQSQTNAVAAATAAASASRRVPQPSSVPRPASASDSAVRVHNHTLSPHPARGFVLRLHDAALPSKLLVVAVPEQRAPEPPNPHVHPPPEEAAAAKAARLKAARSGRKVRKASSATYVPVAATSLQPEMAARMHTGFERTFIPDLSTADHRLDLPEAMSSVDAQEQAELTDSSSATRPQTARALLSHATTTFFHSPHARALQSALTGQVAPPQTGVPTVTAALPHSTLAALASTSRAPVDDLLGVHARSGAGQHAALTSRSRHWHNQHSLKTELARLALVAQYAAARPPPGSAPSHSSGVATAATAAAAGGWMHAPSPAAIRDRLGSTSLAPPRPPPPPALSDLPRTPQLERPFGRAAASMTRVPQHGLSLSGALETSDATQDPPSDPFANPADWMRSGYSENERPKSSGHGSSSARVRGLAAKASCSAQPSHADALVGFGDDESKEQPPSSAATPLGHTQDLSALAAHVRSASFHQASSHPAHAKHLSMHETLHAEQAQAHAQGLRAAARAKVAAEARQAEADALHERKTAHALRDQIIAASTAEAAAEEAAASLQQQDQEKLQPVLSGSSDPSLPAASPTVIFRSGEHLHSSPSSCPPLHSTPAALRPDDNAVIPATVRKPSQPQHPQATPSPAPQLTLRNNAAPAASRVRTARMAAAVSAFSTAARVDPAKPVLHVKPLLSSAATDDEDESNGTSGLSGLSARMRMMLAFGAQSARQQQQQEQAAHGHQQQQQSSKASTQSFPMRPPIGINNAQHHAREAAAAQALSAGSPHASLVPSPGHSAPPRAKSASVLSGMNNMLLVSKFTRRLKHGSGAKGRATKNGTGRASSAESGTEGKGDSEEQTSATSPSPRSYRRNWFDVKLSSAGPTRTQVIAERQRELAWAIHRQRIEAEGQRTARAASAEGEAEAETAAEIAQFGGSYTSAARMHERATRSHAPHVHMNDPERKPQAGRNKSLWRQRSSMAGRAQTAAAATASCSPNALASATTPRMPQPPADILVVEH